MMIPLRRGRLLNEQDVRGSPLSVVVNESFAKRWFPNQDALGQQMRVGPNDGEPYTVVGVVGDVKQVSLEVGPSLAVYVTPSQWHFADNAMWLVARTRGDPSNLTPSIRNAIWSVDKDQPITRVATMDFVVAATAAERRFAMVLFSAFALVALLLAAAGIYGVLSGNVAERTREIGVRSALGASRGEILGLIAKQGMALTAIGAVLGLLGAAAATKSIASLMFGISRLDPITYLGVVVVLGVVAAIACAVPAWRAARVDPAITLRTE
jgi:putative ABC transport system permease protein